MIKGDADYLKDIASKYVCSEHLTEVVVAWHAQEDSYVLRCGQGEYPEEVTRQPSFTELYKQGQLPPGPIADNIERRERKKAMSTNKQLQSVVLGNVPKADLATGEKLTLDQIQGLMHYAAKYGLDIYRGHVVMMYGEPYIGLDGYLYHAYKEGIPYQLRSRPLDELERNTYRVEPNDHSWTCEVIRLDTASSFTGLGIVTKAEIVARSTKNPEKLRSPVVAAHPWQLAQKRAEWQAMRRAFPIGETEEVTSEA